MVPWKRASPCRRGEIVKHPHAQRLLGRGGWLLIVLLFGACDPSGCSCTGRRPLFSCSCVSLARPPDGGVDAGIDAGRPRDAGGPRLFDARVEGGCTIPLAGEPCDPRVGCGVGVCSAETSVPIAEADGGIAGTAVLDVPLCRFGPVLDDCPCGAVEAALRLGPASVPYVPECLRPCTFDPLGPGDCPASTTCVDDVCQPVCTEDAFCQRRFVDSDGDGALEWVVTPESGATCDARTGRCFRPGRPGATLGDPCADDHDCAADGTCWRFYGDSGACVRTRCTDDDCSGDAVCIPGRPSVCMPCALARSLGLWDPRCDRDADGGGP